ncbi:MAG: 4Fe-4S dicluster domain-containing protein [Pseudomonadota bacterium]
MELCDILRIDYGKCPPGCRECEKACEQERGGKRTVIKVISLPEVGFCSAITCHHCGQPACLEACSAGAIVKTEEDGVVRVEEERCVGCGLCLGACPYGAIFLDPVSQKAVKCDYCNGEPKCVDACPYGLISYQRGKTVFPYLGKDAVTPAMGQCQGCGAELGIRFAMRVLGEDIVAGGGPGCSAMMIQGTESGGSRLGPGVMTFMTNLPSTMTGIKRYYQKIGKEVRCVVFAGDGISADVGFQTLSATAERGENLIYICNDNEAYMATGIQRSSTTPWKAWTGTTPIGTRKRGKGAVSKYMPLLMALHGVAYVATASVAYLEDFALKLEKAKKLVENGFCYLHMLAPCPTGWRAPTDSTVEMARMAVETNYFPLWEMEGGRFRMTYPVARPRPLEAFTKLMGRFGHLNQEELREMQNMVDERVRFVEDLCRIRPYHAH